MKRSMNFRGRPGKHLTVTNLGALLAHYDFTNCRVCNKLIRSCELCEECAKGNDPFVSADNCGKDLRR
jgi:hypothetical protein